jgi:HK97 family phage portal protein
MKLFGLNISVTRSAAPPVQRSLSPEAAAWLSGRDHEPIRTQLDNPFHRVAWIYRAASVLAEQIANIPFLFSRGERGREHLITSGPLHDFYDQPHPHINRFQYWELRVLWLLLRGECFRVPIYEDAAERGASSVERGIGSPPSPRPSPPGEGASFLRRKRLRQVVILNPDHFREVIQDHRLIGWRYTGFPASTPIESQVFLPEEVWHDKLPDPFNFWRGLSPLHAADLAARADFAAGNFMRGVMENNGDLGLIVRTTDPLSEDQKDQLLAALRNRKNGAGVADRPPLLWNSCEIVKPTLTAADMQFLENRKFCRTEICAALGVPEEIVATTDHNKYDVMQGARLNFIENRVAPLCARLEASERATVKAIDPNALGWFDLDSLPIMQQARRDRLDAAKTGFEMGIPFNELNRMFDLGFPDLPHGNTCYLPKTLQEAGAIGAGGEEGKTRIEPLITANGR